MFCLKLTFMRIDLSMCFLTFFQILKVWWNEHVASIVIKNIIINGNIRISEVCSVLTLNGMSNVIPNFVLDSDIFV